MKSQQKKTVRRLGRDLQQIWPKPLPVQAEMVSRQ